MDLESFISGWEVDPAGVKDVFVGLKGALESLSETKIHFHARPGITYSMRGEKTSQSERQLFVLVDAQRQADSELSTAAWSVTRYVDVPSMFAHDAKTD